MTRIDRRLVGGVMLVVIGALLMLVGILAKIHA